MASGSAVAAAKIGLQASQPLGSPSRRLQLARERSRNRRGAKKSQAEAQAQGGKARGKRAAHRANPMRERSEAMASLASASKQRPDRAPIRAARESALRGPNRAWAFADELA